MLNQAQMAAVKSLTAKGGYKPEGYIEINRRHRALSLCFEGLLLHYGECVAEDRIELWSATAKAIIDLFASEPHGVTRETLGPTAPSLPAE